MPGRLRRLQAVNTHRTREAPRPRLRPRGLPPALEPHGVYSAGDPAEAASYGRDILGVHRVHVSDGDVGAFESTFHGVLVRDVTLGYLDYTTAVRVEVQQLPDDVLVIVPANGTSTITVEPPATSGNFGNNVGESMVIDASPVRAAVPQPGRSMVLECDAEAAHLIVRIARPAFEVHLSRLLGRSLAAPIEFDPVFDLASPRSSRWNFAIQMLHAELYEPQSLLHSGEGHGQLEEFVMSALLHSQPSNYSDWLSPSHAIVRQTVRSACDFIERNLATELTVGQIASHVGVSVRTLQHQFAEDLHQTVTRFMRNRRLERVRADLADAHPTAGVTVTDIATRWGFTHLGRFAVTYRQRFGESPSQTLRN